MLGLICEYVCPLSVSQQTVCRLSQPPLKLRARPDSEGVLLTKPGKWYFCPRLDFGTSLWRHFTSQTHQMLHMCGDNAFLKLCKVSSGYPHALLRYREKRKVRGKLSPTATRGFIIKLNQITWVHEVHCFANIWVHEVNFIVFQAYTNEQWARFLNS